MIFTRISTAGAEFCEIGGYSEWDFCCDLCLASVTAHYYISDCNCVYHSYENMSMPMGSFAAFKVRDNMNKEGTYQKSQQEQGTGNVTKKEDFYSAPPAKYNEKMMMSIWGLYNRYSVHNMKSHKDLNKN